MTIAAPIISHFDGGEISPLYYGRVDSDRYKSSLALCRNWITTLQGGLNRRPGTAYVNAVKDSTSLIRLIPFVYSSTDAYVCEFGVHSGTGYIRLYTNYGLVLSGGSPLELTHPYAASELAALRFAQSADTLYIVHPNHPPYLLQFSSFLGWSMSVASFTDGPYLDENTTTTTLTAVNTSGSLNTVTASQPLFVATDVGRLIRVNTSGNAWLWGIIVSYSSATVVTVQGQNVSVWGFTSSNWRLGAWSGTTGYPGAVTFHEDRLCFTGTTTSPQRVDLSVSSDYQNFSPTSLTDGTVVDSNAMSFNLNANDVNANVWMNSDEQGLMAGSTAAEWIIRPSDTVEAMTPTNISAKRSTRWGSAAVNTAQVGKAVINVQRGARKIRELMYYFDINGYRSTDLTELAEHITGSGVIDMTYQSIPISVVWVVRNDGALLGMTYDRDMNQLRVGWHQHFLGGASDALGTPAAVESIATIPSPDGSKDDVWMVVRRYINGQTVRYIEYLTKIFEDIDAQNNAFFLDCGLTYTPTSYTYITGITQANPVVVTAPSHGLTTGNTVLITGVNGMTELNGRKYTVNALTANTFALLYSDGSNVDGTSFSAYTGGGLEQKCVTTISGLSYLQGETVSIYADGAFLPPQVVSGSGTVTLELPCARVSVGYAYNSDGQTLRLEAGSRNGTSFGKTRRIHRLTTMLHRSQGLQLGPSFTALDPVQFRTQGVDPNGQATTLFSGITPPHLMAFDYDFDNQICFRAAGPFPCILQAFMPQMETQDNA